MSQKQIDLTKHLSFLISHARSNATRFTSHDGVRQDIESGIEKAQNELSKIIKEYKQTAA